MELNTLFNTDLSWGYQSGLLGKTLTSFRVGGCIHNFCEPNSISALISLVRYLLRNSIPFRILGRGSNVLIPDEGIKDVVVSTKKCNRIVRDGAVFSVECGASLPRFISYALECGFGGLEALYSIPASIGGAVYMNAGAFGTEICDSCRSITVLARSSPNEAITISAADAIFGYRKSIFQSGEYVILSANFSLEETDVLVSRARIMSYQAIRRKKQPLGLPSAGSIFRSPEGDFAARLIDASGCKGMRVGDAIVSPKHAGFILNLGDATAIDILALISHVKHRVHEHFGIWLETELEIW